jgi:diguanylate cyclase (GGDEF)-like protein
MWSLLLLVPALAAVVAAIWLWRRSEHVAQAAATAVADRQFLGRFVHELPQVAHELHAGGYRHVPTLLLNAIVRLLEPEKATIWIARRRVDPDAEEDRRLTVAACWPEGAVPLGTHLPAGAGEIGFAVEMQWVMDRRDLESQPTTIRDRLREQSGPAQLPDVIAPMVFKGETVGVITLEGLKRSPAETKDVVRLFALVGAVSLYTHARYTEMHATASLDGLTGVFNKRHLTTRLAEEIQSALAQSRTVSVFIFDVDNFKQYNDRNGHVAGDRLLTAVARLARANTRRDTIVGRFGGDEFLLIFPGALKSQALHAAENVRRAIERFDFSFGFDQPLGLVSISGGVAECPFDGADSASLVRAADEALYAAKRSGRNRVLAFSTAAPPPAPAAEGSEASPLTADPPDVTPSEDR